MIMVRIAGMAVDGRQASEGWINQMIVESRRQGSALCVQVEIQQPPVVQMVLTTPGYGGGGGGGRLPNELERKLFDAWNRRGLGTGEFSAGQLRAFLNEAERAL